MIWLLVTVTMLVVLGGVGRMRERRHLDELSEREARLADLVLVDTKALPTSLDPVHGELVLGNAVIGTDYLKQWFARWRMIFGGEMHSYQTVLGRARREAQLRMMEEAYQRGARAIVNVRYDTSQVATALAASEVLCYGTMVR